MSEESQSKGYLLLGLCAHLPYVRHREDEDRAEDRWLFETLTESYLPLLHMLDRLSEDEISGRFVLALSPTLMAMLDDELLRDRYVTYLDGLLELAQQEVERTRDAEGFRPIAAQNHERYMGIRSAYLERYGRDVLGQLIEHHKAGRIELIPTAATYPILPLLGEAGSVRVQVRLAAESFERRVGEWPRGMWLPDCGFNEVVEEILANMGVWYTFVSARSFSFASHQPLAATFAPLVSEAGTAFFARDTTASQQVESARQGYPADALFREFYRDIGFDLARDYMRPYIHPDATRMNASFKYYRITGQGEHKELYDAEAGARRATEQAEHFVAARLDAIQHAAPTTEHPPAVVCLYPAELFGRWWYEGFAFLEGVIRRAASHPQLSLATPSDYLIAHPTNQVSSPSTSSCSDLGSFAMWLDESNAWLYRYLHLAERRMLKLARKGKNAQGVLRRAIDQAAREMLLAQASDWAYIMRAGSAVEYAVEQTRARLTTFHRLYEQIESGSIDDAFLSKCEAATPIFEALPIRSFIE